jgi:DNA polymerase III delta prime subunit
METLNVNQILNREKHATQIKDILKHFEENKHNPITKKGIYIYGDPGSGKTSFIINILKELNYDVIKYDAGDIRNKSIIDTITKHNMSDKNIMSLFQKKIKRIAIVMDEIDGMNNGDKGGINSLIKIIRPKKTKKQRLEEITLNPIICIGNYHMDKKIKELMKVCHVIELKTPIKSDIKIMLHELKIPNIDLQMENEIINFIQGDLRKLKCIYDIYSNSDILTFTNIQEIFHVKSYNDDTRKITKKLINNCYSLEDHLNIMNETDRTIVGLLWHENIIDVFNKMKKEEVIPFYLNILNNMCFADYIDRITFQKQIWQFNEMSSLIKTFKNNKLYHDTFTKNIKYNPTEVRFTKVLTKYSTEYNNSLFIQNLCQQLGMDKKDLFTFFLHVKNKYTDIEILTLFENYEISKLDINRIYRYIEKYTKEDAVDIDDISVTSLDKINELNDI